MNTWISSLLVLGTLGLGLSSSGFQGPQLESRPKVIEMKAPEYPAIAHAAHAVGTVAVEVEINSEGNVASVRVVRGHPLLSAASRQAALAWRFEPNPSRAGQKLELLFDFAPSDSVTVSAEKNPCRNGYSTVDPYHLKIYGYAKVAPVSDTENDIPENLEGTLCKVHHERLQRDKVEISYGLMSFNPGYLKAEKRLFPNANEVAFGGCVIETQTDPCSGSEIQISPKYAEVLYCAACRRAHARWSKTHPRKS